jgi:hypothetical protein
MRAKPWLAAALGAALWLAGCAGGRAGVVDERVRHAPASDRRLIEAAQRNVLAAESRISSARSVQKQAVKFRDRAHQEANAAEVQLDAARRALDLHGPAITEDGTDVEARGVDEAQKQLLAILAKKDFADGVVELRAAQVHETEAELDLARADLLWTKLEVLRRNRLARGLDPSGVIGARAHAERRLAQSRVRTAELEIEVVSLRASWDERRRTYDVATRDHATP